jgi:hypothetical protein
MARVRARSGVTRDGGDRQIQGVRRFRAHGELMGFVDLVPRLSGHAERRGGLTQGGSAHVEGPRFVSRLPPRRNSSARFQSVGESPSRPTSGCCQQRLARGRGIFRRVIGGPEAAPARSDEEAACARLD